MPAFDQHVRCDAPAEEVWKLLYDPARFPQWWAGIGSVDAGADGSYTMYPDGYPDFPMPQLLRASRDDHHVSISCLVSDLRFEWTLTPLDDGRATQIHVHVEIPDQERHRLASQQRVIEQSITTLAALATTG